MRLVFCNYFRNVIFFWGLILLIPGVLFSQTTQPTTIERLLNIEETKPKLLFAVIPFKYQGMTENSAILFGNRLAEDLKNIPRFESISPEKILEFLRDTNPNLSNCNDIDCGMPIARMFSARYYIATNVIFDNNVFQLSFIVVDVATGNNIYTANKTVNKDNVYGTFNKIARLIHENIPVEGQVIGAGKRKVVINIGSNDNVQLNDKVVVYKKERLDYYDPRDLTLEIEVLNNPDPLDDDGIIETNNDEALEPPQEDILVYDDMRAVLSVIEITRIEADKSEGLLKMTSDINKPAEKGNSVKFYINKFRQIQLYENARRQIDQYQDMKEEPFRLPKKISPIKKIVEPPVIIPVPLPIIERNEWIYKVRHWESERDFFQYMLIGSLMLGVYTFYSYDVFHPVQLLPIGFTTYSTYAFLFSRAELNRLIEEGKFKGYIRTIGDSHLDPGRSSDYSPKMVLSYRYEF